MSKKLSKVLVVAVVLVLSMSLFALVACGGPEPLDSKGAMAELQKNFNSASGTKTVKENVKLGGIDVKISELIELKIDNVDVALTRTYKADGSLTINAVVSNVKLSIPKGFTTITSLVPQVAPSADLKGLNEEVLNNLKFVEFEADVTMMNPETPDPTDESSYENYLVVNTLELRNLDKVTTGKDGTGDKWGMLADVPSDLKTILPSTSTNPRHDMNTENPDGIFAAMDHWCKKQNAEGMGPGSILEQFIIDNYKMISAYNFKEVTVDGSKISSNAKADLTKVTGLGQEIIDLYKDHKPIDGNDLTVGGIIDTVAGKNKTVKDLVNMLTNLNDKASAVNMTGEMVAVDGKWQISKLNTAQTIHVKLDKGLLNNVVNLVKKLVPAASDILAKLDTVIQPVLAAGLETDVKASVNATFTYGE